MKKRKVLIIILAAFLALLMLVPILSLIFSSIGASAGAVSEEELYELQQQQDELQRRQDELEGQISAYEGQRRAVLAQKEILDEQVSVTRSEIKNLEAQIAVHEKMIEEKEREYNDAEEAEEYRMERFRLHVRAMEEEGTMSYWSVLFSAKSFSDLLGRMDFISEIMADDEEVVERLNEAQAATEAARDKLESAKTDMENSRLELEAKIAELDNKIAQAEALIREIDSNVSQYEAEFRANLSAEEELAQQILDMTQELERIRSEEDAARAGVNATGRYIWPSDSLYVTENYGMRLHPILYTYTMHNGIDIGASYGTNIYAADGGTVTTATSSSSYGNYVMLYHGNNRYTLYAHMSEILVDVGESVSQGEIIGLVGSTGWSTGPHIHFEIIENGAYSNPLEYFTNYIVWW